MLRDVIGVIVGSVVWMVGFLFFARLLYLVWPDYALHAETWMNTQAYDFSPVMSVLNALFWALAEVCAGCLTRAIAKHRQAVWVLAGIIACYLAFMHLYYDWANLPWWYNLAVAIPAAPAVLLGGWLAGSIAADQLRSSTSAA